MPNYERIFKMRLPHMDTVDEVMRQINETELVKSLIMRKVFYKFRFFGKYYRVAVEGSHVMNVKEGHCEHCQKRTSKKSGKTTYFHNVLEAKLVCANGFSISLATEWIENPDEDYNKQDCEQKAFMRLAQKLKQAYPRLPICIVVDALYPNQSFFRICRDNDWCWVVTFKDGNLPSVWEEVLGLQKIIHENIRYKEQKQKKKNIKQQYTWINDIDYKGFVLSWYECVEIEDDKQRRFVYVSNLSIDYFNILEMTATGRMRWKIENEGFDVQKNHGYGLGHKYSRLSMMAMKNYYQCMQIAHMLNQLFELSSLFQPLLAGKMTIVHIWSLMLGQLRSKIKFKVHEQLLNTRIQIRYS